ncbi:hypothetical protein E4T44_13702 [Aureobasidium sp. EXF-8845]|nr:hypothetical protein E4T44_13702 [Aureobasidium sp. EXF-8845]KAI4851301.1 hypothetical protein E4T45_05142 [Aureobasidium sp. EXF-8846]
MASFLLFCIGQVPVSTIDALLQTMQHNFLSLVRDTTQSTFDAWYTEAPVAPSTSDFLNRDQIRTFITEHIDPPPKRSDLEPCQYAILDERSALDQTVILAHSYSSRLMRDTEAMTDEEYVQWEVEAEEYKDEEDDCWWEWRVTFKDAEDLEIFLCFEQDFTPKLYVDDFVARYTTAEGVFQPRVAFEAWSAPEVTKST